MAPSNLPVAVRTALDDSMLRAVLALRAYKPSGRIVEPGSGTWRLQYPLDHLRQRFSPDVAARITGITPRFCELTDGPDTLVGYQREAKCRAWL